MYFDCSLCGKRICTHQRGVGRKRLLATTCVVMGCGSVGVIASRLPISGSVATMALPHAPLQPQAEEQLQQLGRRHAAVLDALPILEEVWAAAAAADPLHDPAAAAQGSASHRAKDGKRAEKGGEGAGGQGAGADRSKASLYERAARALARPEGRAGVRPWDLSGRARGRRRGGEGGGSGGDYGGGGGGGADVGPGAHV